MSETVGWMFALHERRPDTACPEIDLIGSADLFEDVEMPTKCISEAFAGHSMPQYNGMYQFSSI